MNFNNVLEKIKTYEAGKPIELVVREFGIESSAIVKLASNENPNGCSPKVKDAVSKVIANMALYPDDSMFALKEALAARFDVSENELIIGSGSDQIIEFLIHAKANAESKILMSAVTFAMYEIYAKHVGAEVVRTSKYEHDFDEFYAKYLEHRPSVIFICTPNNPTGDAVDRDALFKFLQKIDSDTMVVVDGAYMEYAAYKDSTKAVAPKELIETFENVVYLGTFSKAYGLGGMRVGYGIASQNIIKALYKLRPPFNITTLSLEAATYALQDVEFVQNSIKECFHEMKRYKEFARNNGIGIIESYTNFVTLLLNDSYNSSQLSYELLKKGVIIRDLSSYGLNAVRITVGTSAQNTILFNQFKALL
ncbi:MAG: histidinol-phosphate transaminase [Campylobacterota bacterium]|nr:histidinol-phosphate transaminase [Campylobacterota bacterium]